MDTAIRPRPRNTVTLAELRTMLEKPRMRPPTRRVPIWLVWHSGLDNRYIGGGDTPAEAWQHFNWSRDRGQWRAKIDFQILGLPT